MDHEGHPSVPSGWVILFCHALGIRHSTVLLLLPSRAHTSTSSPLPSLPFFNKASLWEEMETSPFVWDAGFWTTCCKLVSPISWTAFASRKTGRRVGHQIEVLLCPQLPRAFEIDDRRSCCYLIGATHHTHTRRANGFSRGEASAPAP